MDPLQAVTNDPLERPSGATAFGWLAIAWGLLGLLAMLYGMRSLTSLGELDSLHQALAASMLLILLLPLMAGIGLLKGAAWGWWVFGFHSVMGSFRNARAFLYLLPNSGMAARTALDTGAACLRLLVFLVFLWYWFSGDLRRWCKVENVPRKAGFAIVCLAAALTIAIFTVWQG